MGSIFRFDLDEMVVDSETDVSKATEVSLLNVMPYVDAWHFINEWFGKGFEDKTKNARGFVEKG